MFHKPRKTSQPRFAHASLPKRVVAGAGAGVIGGMVHAVVNELDRRLLRHNADDLAMLGGTLTDDPVMARRLGIGMHFGFAGLFGACYAAVLRPADNDDALRKAIAAAMTEHIALYPLVFPLEQLHPFIRDGRLDRFAHPTAFVQATLRHLGLGIGIGIAYPSLLRSLHQRWH